MNGILAHDAAEKGYTGQRTTYANEMNFGTNHAPGAGSITQPVNLQSYYHYATDAPSRVWK